MSPTLDSLRGSILLSAAMSAIIVAAQSAGAQSFTLSDNNSSIDVNATLRAAISSWNVDGVEHLEEISNWWRLGSTGPEASAHLLSVVSASAFNTKCRPA